RAVGRDVEDQPVEVGGLLDAGGLDAEGRDPDRREDRVDRNDPDGRGLLVAIRRGVAASALDGQVGGGAASRDRGDHQVLVENVHVACQYDVARRDRGRAPYVQA